MTQEALKLALEALEESKTNNDTMEFHDRKNKAITAIKEALAQTELCKYGQEPKSCTSNPMDCQCAIDASLAQTQEPDDIASILACRDMLDAQPVPQRTWVGLTDEEIDKLRSGYQSGRIGSFVALAQAIEAKLKEKNT